MNKVILITLFCLHILYADKNETHVINNNIWDNNNIWIKVYSNNKNYNTIINNIVKIEQKIKKSTKNQLLLDELNTRLEIQKSKLNLYERKKSFETILFEFKFEVPEITIREYILKNLLERLNKKIDKYVVFKNEFYKALSLINNYHKNKKQSVSKLDVKYFKEYVESIEKIHINLLESRDELQSKYIQYSQDNLQKHITTSIIIVISYIIYKIISFFLFYIERTIHKDENQKNYKKILSILFFLTIFIFLVVRYLDDLIYIVTFLSVVAAALTIALREVILNLVASAYMFFSNMIRVGDRIMIQFETKHTIGDVTDMSLMKIKLNEIEDYTNVKEVKNVGRTIYIPNSYVFTKVFYNYSRKKDGLINDLIEFEFATDNDFKNIENVTNEIFSNLQLGHTMTFTLNNLKTGVIGLISYQTNYKTVSQTRGDVSIKLLQAYMIDGKIKLKSSKASVKSSKEDTE